KAMPGVAGQPVLRSDPSGDGPAALVAGVGGDQPLAASLGEEAGKADSFLQALCSAVWLVERDRVEGADEGQAARGQLPLQGRRIGGEKARRAKLSAGKAGGGHLIQHAG